MAGKILALEKQAADERRRRVELEMQLTSQAAAGPFPTGTV